MKDAEVLALAVSLPDTGDTRCRYNAPTPRGVHRRRRMPWSDSDFKVHADSAGDRRDSSDLARFRNGGMDEPFPATAALSSGAQAQRWVWKRPGAAKRPWRPGGLLGGRCRAQR